MGSADTLRYPPGQETRLDPLSCQLPPRVAIRLSTYLPLSPVAASHAMPATDGPRGSGGPNRGLMSSRHKEWEWARRRSSVVLFGGPGLSRSGMPKKEEKKTRFDTPANRKATAQPPLQFISSTRYSSPKYPSPFESTQCTSLYNYVQYTKSPNRKQNTPNAMPAQPKRRRKYHVLFSGIANDRV